VKQSAPRGEFDGSLGEACAKLRSVWAEELGQTRDRVLAFRKGGRVLKGERMNASEELGHPRGPIRGEVTGSFDKLHHEERLLSVLSDEQRTWNRQPCSVEMPE